MITVTLQYDSLQEAHAALGNMLAQAMVDPLAGAKAVVTEAISAIDETVADAAEAAMEAPPQKKKRGRPRKKTAKIYSSEEVAALKDAFSAFTKDKGFIKAKALLNEFEGVRRFGDLASHQHEMFDRLMNTAA